MDTSNHTPGPWTVGETVMGSRNKPIPEGLTTLFRIDGIAVYVRSGTLGDDPAADARLAAAAPELLAACKAALNQAWTEDGVRILIEDSRGDLYRQLSAALEKAGV